MARVELDFDLSNLTDLIDISNDELATVYRIGSELDRLAEPVDGYPLVVQWSPSVVHVLTGLDPVRYAFDEAQDLLTRSVKLIHGALLKWDRGLAILTLQCVVES